MKPQYAPQHISKGKIVQIHNCEMYYEEYGQGKPLILLHGFGGCTQNWQTFIPELSEHYHLIVIDLPGHGYSTNPQNSFTHRKAAIDVFSLLDQLGIEQFSAIGMSTGGMILLHMATTQSKRVESLIIISATTHFPQQARTIMRRASYETMPDEVQEMYQECAKRGEEQVRQLISQFNAFSENLDDMNFDEQSLSTISAKSLIIHGEKDHFFPLDIPKKMQQSIPNAEIWIIPDGVHVPIFDIKIPFTKRALEFLEK